MRELKPRRVPRQARSRATVEAILEGCARVLEERGLSGLTTNAVAAKAGVGIGSLYDFFPSREAVVTALAQERLEALRRDVEAALDEALRRSESQGLLLLLSLIVERVAADRALFRALLREAPFLREVPEIERAIARLFDLGPLARARATHRKVSPKEAANTWLMSRMLAGAVLDIAFTEPDESARRVLVRELARLGFRMFAGRDPNPPNGKRRLRRSPPAVAPQLLVHPLSPRTRRGRGR